MFSWLRKKRGFPDIVREILRAETHPLLSLRKLKVIEFEEWWETGVILENPGKALLRFSVDRRDRVINVEFLSPFHLNDSHTFVKWPYCDDPFHRFSLWQMLRSDSIIDPVISRQPDVGNPDAIREYVSRSIEIIVFRYLDVIDGDLSIAEDIVINRQRSVWDSEGE